MSHFARSSSAIDASALCFRSTSALMSQAGGTLFSLSSQHSAISIQPLNQNGPNVKLLSVESEPATAFRLT